MPYRTEWESPERAVVHNGVTVYHVYKNNEFDSGTLEHWYTLDEYDDDETDSSFDVRELKAFSPDLSHEDVLRAAIESGELSDKED